MSSLSTLPLPRAAAPGPRRGPGWRRLAAGLALGGLLAAADLPAAGLEHRLYVCATLEKAFFIGSRKADSGLFATDDRVHFEHVGWAHPREDDVAAAPGRPGALYVAAANGLLHTADGGSRWRILTGWDMTELKAVVVDPRSPLTLYVALPDGIGVSRDGGATWARGQAGIARPYTQCLAMDPGSGRLLAGTERGIYRSDDGARSWTRVLPTAATVNAFAPSPRHPAVLLAATQADGAWRSDDGGSTWRPVAGVPAGRTLHACAADASADRWALCGWDCGVLASEDGGRTWVDRNAGLPNVHVWCVAADPDIPGRLYCSPHASPVFVSDDWGRSWRPAWFESAIVRRFVFLRREKGEGP